MSNSKLVKFKDKKGNEYPYLFIDEMTGEFYAVKRIAATVKKKPLGKEFVKARAGVLSAIQEMIDKKPVIRGNTLVMDFFKKVMEEKQEHAIQDSTREAIEGIWRNRIEPFWGHMLPEDITQAKVTEFMKWHRRHLPGVQFFNTFKYLGNIFNKMAEEGALELKDIPKLTIPLDEQKHHDKEKGRYIEPAVLNKILEHLEEDEALFVEVDYVEGFRKSEWAETEKDRLVLADDHYVIKFDTDDTKTGMAREVPIPARFTNRITAQIKKHPKSKYLFPMKSDPSRPIYSQLIDKFWKDAKTKAGIKGRLRFHDLRHSAARNFAKANVNPIIACTILGMSLSMYQKVYCKLKASDLIMAVEQSAAQVGVA